MPGPLCAIPLWVGTSGYSYPEWTGAGFYPAGTGSGRMLRAYAARFAVTELNHTWYQMPRAEALGRQLTQVPARFLFAAKVTRTLTHEIDPASWRDEARAFREGLAPLVAAGRLAAALVQLPQSFDRSLAHRGHLSALLDELHGLPLAVEFRSASWATDRVFAELERRAVTLVTVDEPDLPGLFPSLDVVTCPDRIYARFHGRNLKSWYSGSKGLQFDYDYSANELSGWIEDRLEPMAERAGRAFLFFNNHVAAQAPRNAELLMRLLRERGGDVVGPAE